MTVNQPEWPRYWLMTDERIGGRLWEALHRLPPGKSGLVFRHYLTPAAERLQLAHRLAEKCRDLGIMMAVARDGALARELGAGFVHNPDCADSLPCSISVHDAGEAEEARRKRAALVFVSPLFPTRSHPGRPALGAARAVRLATMSGGQAIALGGMNAVRFEELEAAFPGVFHGYAGIDCWLSERPRT